MSHIADALRKFRWGQIIRVVRWPARSVASRIALSVLGAALATGLAVTWTSSQTTEAFLRDKIDQKFLAILRGTAERLDLWFAQRQVDVVTFARSSTVAASVDALLDDPAGAHDELSRYLTYVLDQFPQYETLLLLDAAGNEVMDVGAELTLPDAYRERLSRVRQARVEPLRQIGERRVQIASAPVNDLVGRRVASLHAVLRGSALEAALASEDLGSRGGIYVVGASGAVVFHSTDAPARERYERLRSTAHAEESVSDYPDSNGNRVVGASLDFSRFGWRLVVEEPYAEAFAPVVAISRELLGVNLAIILFCALIAYEMARSIVRPIVELSAGALRIADGEADVVIQAKASRDEIGVMLEAFNTMARRLAEKQSELESSRRQVEEANDQLLSQNSELQRVNEVFQQLSITDELTKLHNHRFFQEQLPREISRSVRTGEALSLVVIDIDDFKKLNDRHGHAVGDAVLRKVAAIMADQVREMDLLARYGGEEFVLLAPRTDIAGAVHLAEKIRASIGGKRLEIAGGDKPLKIRVTASFGVALFHGDDKALFNDADRALYIAKGNGKDCVIVAEDE